MTKSMNWPLFKQKCNDIANLIETKEMVLNDVDIRYEELINSIKSALLEAGSIEKPIKYFGSYWWNKDCQKLVEKKVKHTQNFYRLQIITI